MRWILLGLAVLAAMAPLLWWREEPRYQGKPLSAWLQDSAGQDEETRALAREILQQAGPAAVPFLLSEFKFVDARWKVRVLEWLARFSPLKIDLRQRGNRIEGALFALSALGTNAAPVVPLFVRMLARDPFSGAACLSQVGRAARYHPLASRAATLPAKQLGPNDPDMREAVVGALRGLGPAAIPALTLALTNLNETVRTRAASLLAEIDSAETAVLPLRGLLRDPKPEVRRAAADGLGNFGTRAAAAGPDLLRLLQDPDPLVRLSAAGALAQIRAGEEQAVDAVLATLEAKDNGLRVDGARTLRYFKRQATQVIPVLLRELTNSYSRVENATLTPQPDASSPSPLDRLKWEEGDFRMNLIVSLRELLPEAPKLAPAAIPILVQALDDDQDRVRQPAVEALTTIGVPARPAVPRLLQSLHENDSDASRFAARALAQIAPEDERVTAALLAALRESPAGLRAAAAEALRSGQGTDPVVSGLIQALSDARHEVRLAAARSLGRMARLSESARAALDRAKQDPFPSVRAAAERALNAVRGANPSPTSNR